MDLAGKAVIVAQQKYRSGLYPLGRTVPKQSFRAVGFRDSKFYS